MRKELAERLVLRSTYRGKLERYGLKPGGTGTTVLLAQITDLDGKIICDHLWFSLGKDFAALNILPGDTVEFSARVDTYRKGNEKRGRPESVDYKLSYPTKIHKLDNPDKL
jgi:hypothetical protein